MDWEGLERVEYLDFVFFIHVLPSALGSLEIAHQHYQYCGDLKFTICHRDDVQSSL